MKPQIILCLTTLFAATAACAEGLVLRTSHPTGKAASAHGAPASATTNSQATATSTSTSRGGHATGVGSQGQSLSIDSHAVYKAQERNPVSTAIAPAIVSSNDTCMGSTSIAGAAASFGFSAGTTWTDTNCVMLKNSREMWNMGFKGAALARLCMDPLNKEAFEATGINCPPRKGAEDSNAQAKSGIGGFNEDPYRY